MKLKLLSVGNNQKLASTIAVFNLPQGKTCPGKTAICAKICYAAKAERMYKAAAAMRERNLVAAQSPTFVAEMIEELDYLIKTKGLSKVRVHESGDFFNQAYLDKWIAIALEEPEITFLAYTKSFHLDYTCVPPNMKIYCSMDSSTPKVPTLANLYPQAHIVLKEETPIAGYMTCQHTLPKHYCGSDCNICWTGKANVYFPQH